MAVELGQLTRKDNVVACLKPSELPALFIKSANSLIKSGLSQTDQVHAFFVPGRIEVLGKHTDYPGGRSLVATAEKGFCLIAAARKDAVIRIAEADTDEAVEFEISPDLEPPLGHWKNYPMTVVRRAARNFKLDLKGMDIAFDSNLPPAAGMSSSSAMMIAVYSALSTINKLDECKEYKQNIDGLEALASYLATMENGQSFGSLEGDKGVGTFGGSEDQTAILCCQPNKLSQYCYCPVRFERFVEVPDQFCFALARSGVVAEKTGAAMNKYNRASLLASKVLEIWCRTTGREDANIAAALKSGPDAVEEIRDVLRHVEGENFTRAELMHRFEHFLNESEKIIPASGDALITGDLKTFGRLVDQSQELAHSLLGNQVPETIFLARAARQAGASAATSFGAGFGGSVWALMEIDQADDFLAEWACNYQQAFPQAYQNAGFFVTRPGPAKFELA